MLQQIFEWLFSNKVEVLGAILGILYIFFSIRQNILTWPLGLLTSVLYTFVFFQSGFYADMGLQVYYVFISIYGWYYWLKGKKPKDAVQLPVQKISKKLTFQLILASLIIYVIILYILINLTDSVVPYMDSLTTALSIVATWMLAKKYIEHWYIWIFVDLFSAGLYIYKGLWPTVILFLVYTTMAFIGIREWTRDLKKSLLYKNA